MTGRRAFIKAVLSVAVGAVVADTLDWDRLAWDAGDGRKTYSIPAKSADGISVRIVEQFDGRMVTRFDILYGWSVLCSPVYGRISA